MQPGSEISITQVANGFLVRSPYVMGQAVETKEFHVFQSHAELVNFLIEHFPLRKNYLLIDPKEGAT